MVLVAVRGIHTHYLHLGAVWEVVVVGTLQLYDLQHLPHLH